MIQLTTQNKQAIYNVLKGLLVAGGPLTAILTNTWGLDDKTVKIIIESAAAVLSIVGLVWLGIGGTDKSIVESAAEVRGVQVHVDTRRAPDAVVEVARSDNQDVLPMIGGPRTDTNKEQLDVMDDPPPPPPPADGYRTLKPR